MCGLLEYIIATNLGRPRAHQGVANRAEAERSGPVRQFLKLRPRYGLSGASDVGELGEEQHLVQLGGASETVIAQLLGDVEHQLGELLLV